MDYMFSDAETRIWNNCMVYGAWLWLRYGTCKVVGLAEVV